MFIDRTIDSGPFAAIKVALIAHQDLGLFVEICNEGFGFAQNAKEIAELLHEGKRGRLEDDGHFQNRIEHAESLEEFAKVHGESEFSYLYALVSLRLWSILETLVKDLSHDMLVTFPELQPIEALKDLKGPLMPFLVSSRTEQAAIILNLLEKELSGPMKIGGVVRFESLLKQFGLDGAVDPLIKRTLRELWAGRNVVAHRNGATDSRFIETCPWFDATAGKQLIISAQHFRRYSMASSWYILEIDRRILIKYPQYTEVGEASLERVQEAQQVLVSRVERLGQNQEERG